MHLLMKMLNFGIPFDSKTNQNKKDMKKIFRFAAMVAAAAALFSCQEPVTPDPGTGDEPGTNPDQITWELNGGEVETVTVSVPTNAELWESLKTYYKTFYNENRSDQAITAVSTFMTKACKIMTDASSEYKWLGDYIAEVAANQGYTLTNDPSADGMEALWRWHVHSFFNCEQRTSWPATADFSTAGKPSAWGPVYQAAHGGTSLPKHSLSSGWRWPQSHSLYIQRYLKGYIKSFCF